MQNTRPKARVCGSGVAPTESIDQYGVRFSCYGGKKIGSNKTGPHNGCFSGVSLSSPFLFIFGFSRISRSSVPYFARGATALMRASATIVDFARESNKKHGLIFEVRRLSPLNCLLLSSIQQRKKPSAKASSRASARQVSSIFGKFSLDSSQGWKCCLPREFGRNVFFGLVL